VETRERGYSGSRVRSSNAAASPGPSTGGLPAAGSDSPAVPPLRHRRSRPSLDSSSCEHAFFHLILRLGHELVNFPAASGSSDRSFNPKCFRNSLVVPYRRGLPGVAARPQSLPVLSPAVCGEHSPRLHPGSLRSPASSPAVCRPMTARDSSAETESFLFDFFLTIPAEPDAELLPGGKLKSSATFTIWNERPALFIRPVQIGR